MQLSQLLNNLETLRVDQIPAVLAQLAAAQGVLAARLLAADTEGHVSIEQHERLLTVKDAAERLNVSDDWLYRRAAKLPFSVRVGRALRFSEVGLERWIRARNGR